MIERAFNNIFEAFLGSPRRVLMTACIGLALFVWLNPGVVRSIGNSLLAEIWPLLVPILTIAGIIYGIRWMIFGPPNKKCRR
jgi:hypothetical protein